MIWTPTQSRWGGQKVQDVAPRTLLVITAELEGRAYLGLETLGTFLGQIESMWGFISVNDGSNSFYYGVVGVVDPLTNYFVFTLTDAIAPNLPSGSCTVGLYVPGFLSRVETGVTLPGTLDMTSAGTGLLMTGDLNSDDYVETADVGILGGNLGESGEGTA